VEAERERGLLPYKRKCVFRNRGKSKVAALTKSTQNVRRDSTPGWSRQGTFSKWEEKVSYSGETCNNSGILRMRGKVCRETFSRSKCRTLIGRWVA